MPDAVAFKQMLHQRPRRVQFPQREGREERVLGTGAFPFTDSQVSVKLHKTSLNVHSP